MDRELTDSIQTIVNVISSSSTCTYRRGALIMSGADQSGGIIKGTGGANETRIGLTSKPFD